MESVGCSVKYKFTGGRVANLKQFPEGWRIVLDMGDGASLYAYVGDEKPPFKDKQEVIVTIGIEDAQPQQPPVE